MIGVNALQRSLVQHSFGFTCVADNILNQDFNPASSNLVWAGDVTYLRTKQGWLILESTYGNKEHQGRAMRRKQLKQVVERSLNDGGAILIPAFSIGRTQELLYELEQIIHQAIVKQQ